MNLSPLISSLERREPVVLVNERLPVGEQEEMRRMVERVGLPEGTAAVVFTSGSTGRPKGVVLSWRALEAAVEMSERLLGVRGDDRWLLALSPAHVGGLGVVVRCWRRGLGMVVADNGIREAMERGVTLASLVPAQLEQLLADEVWRPPATLRAVLLGGARASERLVERAKERGVPVMTTYGMSETFGQVATAPLGVVQPKGAVGRALDGVSIEAGTREQPEIIRVRTPAMFSGYLGEGPAGDEVVTADLGFVEDGWLHVVGRVDDVIVTGGAKVHPSVVEAALLEIEGVREACVCGVPDETWGQIIGAMIVGDARAPAGIAAMPSGRRPRVVRFVDALPLGPTGKVDRKRVAAMISASAS